MKKLNKKAEGGFLIILVVLSIAIVGFIYYMNSNTADEAGLNNCLSKNTEQNNVYTYDFHFGKGWTCVLKEPSVGDCMDVSFFSETNTTTYCKISGGIKPIGNFGGVEGFQYELESSCKAGIDGKANNLNAHKVDSSLCN